ncbi:MAG: HAMP domain-containing histidine kinase [Chloroflexi bacterium]|nr:HAMP domain-containing histidine kinase [Chloroflexota bacterium]
MVARQKLRHFNLSGYLETRSQRFLGVLAAFLILVVIILDWVTGPDISTSIFFLLPIALGAWYMTRRAGLVLALIGALAWLAIDLLTNSALRLPLVPFWNAGVRLGFFIVVVITLSSLRTSRQRQDDLLTFVVHDIRSPLGNMLTALELLEQSVGDPTETINGELVLLAKSSGNRILILINSLLDLDRLESGRMPVTRQRVEVADLFSTAVAQLQLTAQRNRVKIETDIEPEVTAVAADPELTERILINLLANAIKFSPVDGVIRLTAVRGPEDTVRFAIADQGPGIPAKWQSQVFAKYRQVGGQTGRVAGGSGLGLTFCKQAVLAQNGRIWLESDGEAGTVMYFLLSAHVPMATGTP